MCTKIKQQIVSHFLIKSLLILQNLEAKNILQQKEIYCNILTIIKCIIIIAYYWDVRQQNFAVCIAQ